MLINTRVLFTAILQGTGVDCICDIGSCDGADSLRLHSIFPQARIFAFEANKYNFERIQADPKIRAAGIDVLPYAVSSANGAATFHITHTIDCGLIAERGSSSLLVHPTLVENEAVKVETRRIDDLLREKFPSAGKLGLWIDVEGAEHEVIQGIEGVKDRVVALHVESARREMWAGQRVTADVIALMDSLGFDAAGANFSDDSLWGDIVFINREVRKRLGWRYQFYLAKARSSLWYQRWDIPGWLGRHSPWLYQRAHRLYHRLGP